MHVIVGQKPFKCSWWWVHDLLTNDWIQWNYSHYKNKNNNFSFYNCMWVTIIEKFLFMNNYLTFIVRIRSVLNNYLFIVYYLYSLLGVRQEWADIGSLGWILSIRGVLKKITVIFKFLELPRFNVRIFFCYIGRHVCYKCWQ